MKLKKNDCLQTPKWVIDELGVIDLDPCAGIDTSIGLLNYRLENGKCGLTENWLGFVYCNPPFSQKEEWAKKMINHGNGILILTISLLAQLLKTVKNSTLKGGKREKSTRQRGAKIRSIYLNSNSVG